jgi:hypothetical protein
MAVISSETIQQLFRTNKVLLGKDHQGTTWYKLQNNKDTRLYYNSRSRRFIAVDTSGSEPKVFVNLTYKNKN